METSDFRHPSWTTAVATVVGYSLIIILLTIVLFVVPWLIFSIL